jgi:2-(1,2-epoxy-1,2-dihydrophenyl)acetyl-CoA isomerase
VSPSVALEIGGGVATIRLARPEAHNAIDRTLVDELAARVDDALEPAAGARALLVCAEGPSFTVGGDLAYLDGRGESLAGELDAMIASYHRALRALAEAPMPVVCAARGGVGGGGLGLLWCADIVLAGADLKLASGFARLGLSGDGGSTWWLPRLVGPRRAAELSIEGRVLSAAEASDWGLVTRGVPGEELEGEARGVAERLAAGPTAAYARMRALLRSGWDVSLAEGLAAEHAAMVDLGASADAREGIAAFAARRLPRFRGR